ncbi:ABC transporter ATP-binding protein [Bacillus piscicola]|uniref:ABC transporter ATP-binding protein n=1 Tax=Bacillus piscicola TaxID=1632684 RepID=UPI001F08BD3C|nr:ABC transporter ATP-binding protein [Bacillus piscicola]
MSILELNQVGWRQQGKQILDNISWEVKKGQHWAILGLNGSGKTSLLKIITGYQWPSCGEVDVLGQRFGKTNIHELRKAIGWVSASIEERFQTRPSDSALSIVLSGKHASVGVYEDIIEQDVRKAEELLCRFHIHGLADQRFTSLSQGEKKKVILARALMASPELLILDEPCSGLDIYSQEELLTAIEEMNNDPEGPTLLLVTHHIEEIVPSITHTLLIQSGTVVASGEKQVVLTESLLEHTFRLPVSIQWEDERPWVRVKRL